VQWIIIKMTSVGRDRATRFTDNGWEHIGWRNSIAVGTGMDFWERLRRSKPWCYSRGSRGREKAVETGGWIQNVMEKSRESSSLREAKLSSSQSSVIPKSEKIVTILQQSLIVVKNCPNAPFQWKFLFFSQKVLLKTEKRTTFWLVRCRRKATRRIWCQRTLRQKK